MTPRRISDAQIVAGIAEATAAWNAPQDTSYYAERFRYTPGAILDRLRALEAAGLVTRQRRLEWGGCVDTWVVAVD